MTRYDDKYMRARRQTFVAERICFLNIVATVKNGAAAAAAAIMNTQRWGPIVWRALHGLPWLMRGDDAPCTPACRHASIALSLRVGTVLPCVHCRRSYASHVVALPPDAIWHADTPCGGAQRHAWSRFWSDMHARVNNSLDRQPREAWSIERLRQAYGGGGGRHRVETTVALWHLILMAAFNFDRRESEDERERRSIYIDFYQTVQQWWRSCVMATSSAAAAATPELFGAHDVPQRDDERYTSAEWWRRWAYENYIGFARSWRESPPLPLARFDELDAFYESLREPDGACHVNGATVVCQRRRRRARASPMF